MMTTTQARSSSAQTAGRQAQMSRAPFQVLIIPYRFRTDGEVEVAVFHRHDGSMWQFLSGGGEDGESVIDAARREAHEEAGLPVNAPIMRLDSLSTIPRSAFSGSVHWPSGLDVVPEHCFAADATRHEIILSEEHQAFEWLTCKDARHKLTWDSNRTALWELRERLKARIIETDSIPSSAPPASEIAGFDGAS